MKPFAKLSKESVSEAGGKGASLGEMTQAGISVPPGFVVLSGAFDEFLKVTDLNVELDAILDNIDHAVTHQVDDASEKIKALILGKEIPKEIASDVEKEFKKLGATYVAVRSSATSEDSKDAAWAGQLESYLNTTRESLLENVKKCWASLFTPRAIFYRFEKGLHDKPISVAVIVQKMIQSEVSGIAFSVHPVTQDYDQLIIESGFGLGEAIVSGAITPDSYVVEKSVKKILDKNIAVQTKGLFRKDTIKANEEPNEWRDLTPEEGQKPSLSDNEVLQLSNLIIKIEKHYGFPVDVEWAREGQKFYIVQSRPITTLSEKKEKVSPTFLDGFDWFLTVTRNMSFWHQWLSNEGHFHHLQDFGIKANLQILTITEGSTRTSAFMHQPNYGEFAKAVMEAVKSGKEIQQLKKKYQKHAKNLLESLGQARKNLDVKTFQKFLDEYRRFCAGLMPMATVGRTGGELLVEKLKSTSIPEGKIPETIATITYPDEHTPLFNSQLDLLKVAEQIQAKELTGEQKKKALQKWLSDYGHIPVNFSDEPWTMQDVEAQLKSLLEKDAKQELRLAKQSHVERIARKKAILKDLNNEEIAILALAVAEGTYINEFRKNVFCRVSLEYRDIFTKIAKMAGSKQWRGCFYLTPDEMLDILNGKKVDIKKLVKKREIVGAYTDEKGKSKLLKPEVTRRFHEVVMGLHVAGADIDQSQAVKGFSANGGKVKGTVKVILSSKDFHKLNPGEILVTTMTSVDFVPIMEKAAAFVTNEGGITSHASIVAREMSKPCIIGTKNATQILKDGDEVEVDADAGVVRIIGQLVTIDMPNLEEYIRLFQFDGFVPFGVSSEFVSSYAKLEGVVFGDHVAWRSYMSKAALEKTLEEGLELYKDQKRYATYKEKLYATFERIKKQTQAIRESKSLTQEEVADYLKLIQTYRILYQKAEFFSTDRAFEKQEEFPVIKKNFKSFDQLKLDGREYLNQIYFIPDSFFFDVFLKKLSDQFDVPMEALVNYSIKELPALFKGERVNESVLNARKQAYVIWTEDNKLKSVSGNEALRFIETIRAQRQHLKTLKGKIANKGKVTAKAKVIKVDLQNYAAIARVIDEMEQGQVLVAETTEPSIIAACKKASAIVTSQGGMMSHAAIVSREMDIPCIVGTFDATEAIQDGDLVEVDADQGIVYIVEN